MRQYLIARFVQKDRRSAYRYRNEIWKLCSKLRRTVDALGKHAPDLHTWYMEGLVLERLIGEVEWVPTRVARGQYRRVHEDLFFKYLLILRRRLARALSPKAGRFQVPRPGGKFAHKVYLGSVVIPGAIVSFYAELEFERGARGGGGTTSATVGGSSSSSGESGAAIEASKTAPKGSKVSGSVSGGSGGPQGTLSVEGKGPAGSTGQVQVGTAGGVKGTITVQNGKGWQQQFSMDKEGLTLSIQNPAYGGLQLNTKVSSSTLTAIFPEFKFGKDKVVVKVDIEIVPHTRFWPKTATQTKEMLRFMRAYKKVVLITAAVVLTAGVAAELLPVVIVQLPRLAPVAAAAL